MVFEMEAKNVTNITETEALVASDGERADAPTERSTQWSQGAFISVFTATTFLHTYTCHIWCAARSNLGT